MEKVASSSLSFEEAQHDLQNIIPLELSNGYIVGGYELPEDVLESILLRMPQEEILNCNLVCRAWKNLIARKSFWKRCFEYRGQAQVWNKIPPIIKEKGCVVLHSQLYNQAFTKNYILNPSGHRQFETWNRGETQQQRNHDGWKIEQVPAGCNPLPKDLFFGLEDTSCFVTTFYWCSKYTVVDLWGEGMNPAVMRKSLPFQIKCSQMYVPRFDCGGVFDWNLKIRDSESNTVREYKSVIQLPASMEWKTAECSFKFRRNQADILTQVRYLVFTHKGKDTQYWAGHYGMKFARACVTVQCLDSDPPEDEQELDSNDDEGSELEYQGDLDFDREFNDGLSGEDSE